MPRPPLARERILDAFEKLLVDEGERAATLDETARVAAVSKGGLLYHFRSKNELATGLLHRVSQLMAEDLALMADAPEGAAEYYIRTSVVANNALDRALIAAARLAQNGNTAAAEALRTARSQWADLIRPHVRDDAALDLVLLVGDGLYHNNSLAHGTPSGLESPAPRGAALDALLALVHSASR